MNPAALNFEEHDKLNLQPFAKQFEKFLIVEHHFADDALVVSLNAPFGSGKSTFLEMWRHSLEQRRKEDPKLPLPIYINAWESDFCGDPLVSILSEFTGVLNKLPKTDSDDNHTVKRSLKAILAAAGNLGNQVIKKVADVDVSEAIGKAKEKWNPETAGEELLADFRTKREALEALKTELRTLFSGMEAKAIIMVDELDRCRPDFAIHYLETIKHIFSTKGLIFVLAVDHGQLAATARALFGQDLNFPEYYRKFASRQVSLPEIDSVASSHYCNHLEQRFLATPEGAVFRRHSGLRKNSQCIKDLRQLIPALKLTPRQLNEVFRVIGHAASLDRPGQNELSWTWASGLIFMTALQMAGHSLYQAIRSDSLPREEMFREISTLTRKCGHQDFWVDLTMTGTAKAKDTAALLAAELYPLYGKYKVQFRSGTEPAFLERLTTYAGEWGYGWGKSDTSAFATICQSIETAQRFLNG